MHPTPPCALLGAAAAPLAAPARRSPVVPGGMMERHSGGLPGFRVVAA